VISFPSKALMKALSVLVVSSMLRYTLTRRLRGSNLAAGSTYIHSPSLDGILGPMEPRKTGLPGDRRRPSLSSPSFPLLSGGSCAAYDHECSCVCDERTFLLFTGHPTRTCIETFRFARQIAIGGITRICVDAFRFAGQTVVGGKCDECTLLHSAGYIAFSCDKRTTLHCSGHTN
jgi:hypothetical protein